MSKKEEYISIASFCDYVGISRVSFYSRLDEFKRILDYTTKNSIESISGYDIIRVREKYKGTKKFKISKRKVKEEFYYSVGEAVKLMGFSKVTFSKKLEDSEFLELFKKSKVTERVKTISKNSIEKVKKFYNENSKMKNFNN